MKSPDYVQFFLFLVIFLTHAATPRMQNGVAPKTGGAFDMDTSDEMRPNVHMTEDSKPLPLNPRMSKGKTTIMNPGQTFMSSKSISENIANGFTGQSTGSSRSLSQKLLPQIDQTTDTTFTSDNLNSILNGVITDQPNPLLENHVYSTQNPNAPSNTPFQQAVLSSRTAPDIPENIHMTPRLIFHSKKPKSRLMRSHMKHMFRKLRERRLQPVGQVTFPYANARPQQMVPSPPNVLVFNKRSANVAGLNRKILQIAENRNSYYLNPIQDTLYDGEGGDALNRYSHLRDTETDVIQMIHDIKQSADDLQIAMDHHTATIEDRLQRTSQLIDGYNIV